jgi:SNF family Na+-dependent transporter
LPAIAVCGAAASSRATAQLGKTRMNATVFFEFEFFALVTSSLFLPIGIYTYMMRKRAISRSTVVALGIVLIALSGIDIFLLQRLTEMAKHSPSLLDDRLFASEVSTALYLLPALFAGIGVNVLSHVLISHLAEAERRFTGRPR